VDDDEPIFPIDDLTRYARGELPREWLPTRAAIFKRRLHDAAATVEALKRRDPELYERIFRSPGLPDEGE
jgi:hypothetical protein